ncbi:sigma-70 family RNA polymerase sigma factor [Streptomyces sp. TLI_171]|uniref:sigma-70 family RNA polymerase sigma factor n=1 Tax=Streptomyces sp. TLI_171 TaxID=1938859 RepID=UPI000C1A1654|nr:sigma-70 family RNA polymerase sigma factor [Streptomyces sp. TLI_171]
MRSTSITLEGFPAHPEPSAAESLQELAARTARGDRDAYAHLYEALAPIVHGIALKVLRDSAQAEEVAQEALLELWRSAGAYRPERGSVRSWICTIAHRRAVDRVRSVRASSERERRVTREEPVRSESAADEAERILESARVRHALAGLSAAQREALVLAYYGGYSQSQIAAVLGVPLGTVKTRMRDGLLRLRTAFPAG